MYAGRNVAYCLTALCVGLLAWIGCDAIGPGEEVERQYVVEAYLVAGEALPPVRLSRTAPVDESYVYDTLAVREADVVLELLDEEGAPAERYSYYEKSDTTGVYKPRNNERVRPLHTYRLEVTIPGASEPITATTTVPDTFSVVQTSADTVVYQSEEQFAFTLTPSRYPGRDQSFYIFSTEALMPEEENLTPLLREVIEGAEEDLSPDDLRVTSSPILNEESYTRNDDGTVTIRLPWVAVAFFGPNRSTTNAVDDNLYDFVRTQNAQQGGGFTPGTIPNVIEHVEGGTGVFGSLARQSYGVFIARPSDDQ